MTYSQIRARTSLSRPAWSAVESARRPLAVPLVNRAVWTSKAHQTFHTPSHDKHEPLTKPLTWTEIALRACAARDAEVTSGVTPTRGIIAQG